MESRCYMSNYESFATLQTVLRETSVAETDGSFIKSGRCFGLHNESCSLFSLSELVSVGSSGFSVVYFDWYIVLHPEFISKTSGIIIDSALSEAAIGGGLTVKGWDYLPELKVALRFIPSSGPTNRIACGDNPGADIEDYMDETDSGESLVLISKHTFNLQYMDDAPGLMDAMFDFVTEDIDVVVKMNEERPLSCKELREDGNYIFLKSEKASVYVPERKEEAITRVREYRSSACLA